MDRLNNLSALPAWKKSVLIFSRLFLSFFGAVLLFALLPLAHGFFQKKTESLEKRAKSAPVVMQRKMKEEKQPERPQRRLRTLKLTTSSRQMKFSMRFTPDLGVGSSDGVSVADNSVGTMVYDESSVDEPPRPVSRMGVPYPRRAKEAGIEGTISLILHIGRTGNVLNVTVVSSPSPLFNKPVMQAVKKWKFTPARNSGVAVQVRMKQNIVFELDS